jgi:hypothetical protein
MKRFLPLLLILLLLPMNLWAAIYYVDSCDVTGDDAHAGTSMAEPWLTIHQVNTHASLAAGDSVLFRRGCTWREQLTVPTSGEAGNVITFGAYGTGANPIISGAGIITSWTSDYHAENLGDILADGFEGNTLDAWTGNTAGAGNSIAVQDTTALVGTYSARSAFTGSTATAYVYKTITAASDIYVVGTFQINQVMFGSNYQHAFVLNVLNGSTSAMRVSIYRAGAANDYRIACYVTHAGGTLSLYLGTASQVTANTPITLQLRYKSDASVGGGQLWVNGTSVASDFARNTSANTIDRVEVGNTAASTVAPANATNIFFDTVAIGTTYIGPETGVANVWNATLTGDPGAYVWFDNVLGTEVASKVACNSARKWYWTGNVLSAYGTVAPSTTYSNPGVEAPARAQTIHTNTKNYLTFENLSLIRSSGTCFYAGATGDVITLSGVSADWSGSVGFGLEVNNTTVTNCTASSNVNNGFTFTGTGTATVAGVTVNNNMEDGFSISGSGTGNFTNCKSYNNGIGGSAAGGDGFTAHLTNVLNLRYCIAYGNLKSGVAVVQDTSGTIYNSVFYNNGDTSGTVNDGLVLASTGVWTVKNNIIYNNYTLEVDYRSGTITSEYNLIYHSAGGTPYKWAATGYNWANYLTNSSQDAHSLNSDPLFVSATDFRLQAGSPAINAGVSVGLTSDYGGGTVPKGSAPDIGAYEFGAGYQMIWGGTPLLGGMGIDADRGILLRQFPAMEGF